MQREPQGQASSSSSGQPPATKPAVLKTAKQREEDALERLRLQQIEMKEYVRAFRAEKAAKGAAKAAAQGGDAMREG